MFTKATLTLSALLIAFVGNVARADEDIEGRLSDRYPFLEQPYRPITGNIGRLQMNTQQHWVLPQYTNEVPEGKIGDRYPLLEQPIQFANVGTKVSSRAPVKVKPFTFAEKKAFELQDSRGG